MSPRGITSADTSSSTDWIILDSWTISDDDDYPSLPQKHFKKPYVATVGDFSTPKKASKYYKVDSLPEYISKYKASKKYHRACIRYKSELRAFNNTNTHDYVVRSHDSNVETKKRFRDNPDVDIPANKRKRYCNSDKSKKICNDLKIAESSIVSVNIFDNDLEN